MIAKFDFEIQNFTFKEGEAYTFKYDIIEGEELIFVSYDKASSNWKPKQRIPNILILSTYEYQDILKNFWTKAELRSDKIDKIIDAKP